MNTRLKVIFSFAAFSAQGKIDNSNTVLSYLLFIRAICHLTKESYGSSILIERALLSSANSIYDNKTLEILHSVMNYYHAELERLEQIGTLNKVFKFLFSLSDAWIKKNCDKLFDDLIPSKWSRANSNYIYADFKQPEEITNLVSRLCKCNTQTRVFNPFAGSASYGIVLNGNHYIAQEINRDIWVIGVLRLLLHKKNPVNYYCQDSIINWPDKINQFDLILATPPFSVKIDNNLLCDSEFEKKEGKKTIENFFLYNGLQQLSQTGRLIGVFSSGILLDKSIIKMLIDFTKMESAHLTIVSLPNNIFSNTNVPCVIILCELGTNEQGKITLVEGSSSKFFIKNNNRNVLLWEDLYTAIEKRDPRYVIEPSLNYLDAKNFRLEPSVYLGCDEEFSQVPTGFHLSKLGNLISEYHAQIKVVSAARIATVKDLIADGYNEGKKASDFNLFSKEQSAKRLNKDLLLVSKTQKIKTLFFKYSDKIQGYCSGNIMIFEIKSNVNPLYINCELHADYIQKQISRIASGITIRYVNIKDFLDINILVPDDQKLQSIIFQQRLNSYKELVIKKNDLENIIEKQKRDFINDLRDKKHNLSQPIGSLQQGLNALKKFFRNNGMLDMVYDESSNITLAQKIDRLIGYGPIINQMLTDLTSEEKFDAPIKLDIFKKLCSIKSGDNYNVLFSPDYNTLTDTPENRGNIKCYVTMAESSFEELIRQIIYNAKRHGFVDKTRNDYSIIIKLSYDNACNNYEIVFSNNGTPMAKGVNTERFGIRGEYAGDTGNTGIGGYRIKTIVENYKGSYKIINNPLEKFPVSIIIKLPKTD